MNKVKFTQNKYAIEIANRNRTPIVNRVYRHFKGGLYLIHGIAKDTESDMERVVYRCLKTGELYSRPKDMFMDIKKTEMGYTFRFDLVVSSGDLNEERN